MYKIEDEKETLICTYEVLEFDEGYIDLPSSQSISLSIPAWDFRDKNGNFVSPGTYEIRTTTPAKFECYIDGEFKTIPMEHLGQRALNKIKVIWK